MSDWRRRSDTEPPVDEPVIGELTAFDAFLRDREGYLRRSKQWDSEWEHTQLLETLRGKIWRNWHRRNP